MFSKLRASFSPHANDNANKDKEVRQRHRLSKPMTLKSSNTLLALNTQIDGRSKNSSHTELSQPSSTGGQEEPRELSPSVTRTSDTRDDAQGTSPVSERGACGGPPAVMKGGELDRPLSPPLSPVKPKRPLSIFSSSRFSSIESKRVAMQRQDSLGGRTGGDRLPSPPDGAPDHLPDQLPMSLSRKQSFTPGVATRAPKESRPEPTALHRLSEAEREYYYNHERPEVSPLSQLEALGRDDDDEWTPPPPVERTHTPSDLEYTHLGGHRLGSLRIVNGRASPASSELSRFLKMGSAPHLTRDVSSDYGDGDGDRDGVTTMSGLHKQQSREAIPNSSGSSVIVRKPVVTLGINGAVQSRKRVERESYYEPEMVEAADSPKPAFVRDVSGSIATAPSPDKTSIMAREYMAELLGSPFSGRRSASPSGSVLKSTSKANEFDDELFANEIEAATQSSSDEADHLTLDTRYSADDASSTGESAFHSCVELPRYESPTRRLKVLEPVLDNQKSDSGYSSNASYQSSQNEIHGPHEPAAGEMTLPPREESAPVAAEREAKESPRRPGPRPLRSSLKPNGSTAPVLPTFDNLYPSTSTLPTTTSTTSAVSEKPSKPGKLQKRHPSSQRPPAPAVVDVRHAEIPPVPADIAANLAIRTQQMPELQHTFRSMHHTNESVSPTMAPFRPMEISFPAAEDGSHNSLDEADLPSPAHRLSFMKWSKNSRRLPQSRRSSGLSQGEAVAIIQHFGTAAASLGHSPYDIAGTNERRTSLNSKEPAPQNSLEPPKLNPHNITVAERRPKPMMDDETAAEVARLRAKAALEREAKMKQQQHQQQQQQQQRRSSFNDRGGIPGRNIRPMSFAGEAPPMPPLPNSARLLQEQQWRPSHRQSYQEPPTTESAPRCEYFQEQHQPRGSSYRPTSRGQPLPSDGPTNHGPVHAQQTWQFNHQSYPEYATGDDPSWPGRLRTNHQEPWRPPMTSQDRQSDYENVFADVAPPPPSHSPRPEYVDCGEEIAPPPPPHSPRPQELVSPTEPGDPWADHNVNHQELVSPIETPDPWAAQAKVWKSRRQSVGEMLRAKPDSAREYDDRQQHWQAQTTVEEQLYPDIPPRPLQRAFTDEPQQYYNQHREPEYGYGDRHQRESFGLPRQSHGPYVSGQNSRSHSPYVGGQYSRSHSPYVSGQNSRSHSPYVGGQHSRSRSPYVGDQHSRSHSPYVGGQHSRSHSPYVGGQHSRSHSPYVSAPRSRPRSPLFNGASNRPHSGYNLAYNNVENAYNEPHQQNTSHSRRQSCDPSARGANSPYQSRHSNAGSSVSLAEELHPPDRPRPHPSPLFGRYSGGLSYGYEPGAGFGGSAGTRTVSGMAAAPSKGIPLRQSFGIDLGDVPIMAEIRRKPVAVQA